MNAGINRNPAKPIPSSMAGRLLKKSGIPKAQIIAAGLELYKKEVKEG